MIIKKYWHPAFTKHSGGAGHLQHLVESSQFPLRHLSWGTCYLLRVSPPSGEGGFDPTGGIQQVLDQINTLMQTAEVHNLYLLIE